MTTMTRDRAGTVDSAPHVSVLTDRCAGCQECVVRCPTGALSMDPVAWIARADDGACVGCRQCVRTCPFGAIEVSGALLVADPVPLGHHVPAAMAEGGSDRVIRGEVGETRVGFATWESALVEAGRCLECPDPTCVLGCPAHNDIPGFIAAIRGGDLDEAHRVLRRTSVLPDICSRVCDQALQCEGACSWSLAGGTPVAIGALERFVTDNASIPPVDPASSDGNGIEVAVVGSGPAGVAAAWELAANGARVTVFDKDDQPGGLLRWGIPDFTLPAAAVRRPWVQLTDAGVTLRSRTVIEPEGVERLLADYDAVVLAHGAGVPLRLPVPGQDNPLVWDATRFLTAAQSALADGQGLAVLGRMPNPEEAPVTVLVVGAGNTAMDVARSARRLGSRAICVDWMDARYAPVRSDELAEARAEGVEVRFSTTLERIEAVDEHTVLAHLRETRQPRATTLPRPTNRPPALLAVDLVVMAMGYRPDPAFATMLPGTPVRRQSTGVPDRRWQGSGLLGVAAAPAARGRPVGTLALGREAALVRAGLPVQDRLWAAGDALVGPSTVVEAMAQGRRAARALLDTRPRRPDRADRPAPRRVLVAYDSRAGHTARIATGVAEALAAHADHVVTRPIRQVGPAELAWADFVVLGTWVDGAVLAHVGPAPATRAWLAALPRLGGKRFATFATYAVAPKTTLTSLRQALETRGAQVVVERAMRSTGRSDGLGDYAAAVLAAGWAQPAG